MQLTGLRQYRKDSHRLFMTFFPEPGWYMGRRNILQAFSRLSGIRTLRTMQCDAQHRDLKDYEGNDGHLWKGSWIPELPCSHRNWADPWQLYWIRQGQTVHVGNQPSPRTGGEEPEIKESRDETELFRSPIPKNNGSVRFLIPAIHWQEGFPLIKTVLPDCNLCKGSTENSVWDRISSTDNGRMKPVLPVRFFKVWKTLNHIHIKQELQRIGCDAQWYGHDACCPVIKLRGDSHHLKYWRKKALLTIMNKWKRNKSYK